MAKNPYFRPKFRNFAALVVFAVAIGLSLPVFAQEQSSDQKPQSQTQSQPDAGGPQGDLGPIIVPKKNPDDNPPPPPPRQPEVKNPAGMPDFSLHVDVANVQVPVLVTTKDGQFIPGLKQDNFKLFEDGVPQTISNFTEKSDAPITAVLLVEFSSVNYYFTMDAIRDSYYFAQTLKPNDWLAVISFDMKSHILADFTQNKQEIYGALNQLQIPGFSENNLFDALYDTLDRVDRIPGRKYIILIASGLDTFSRINYDKILKKIKDTPNVGIFTISTGQLMRNIMDARYGADFGYQMRSLSFLQADNEMNTFAKMTGGRWYHPTFEGELPDVFRDIASNIRNQYVLTYKPTNSKQDGTYRKLKVELQAPNGGPLTIKDQKGHTLKPNVIYREGYKAKHEVE
jgi:VWFA-related protein